jgi:hypothetical protein
MKSFPWSLVYLVVALGGVFFMANWGGRKLEKLHKKIQGWVLKARPRKSINLAEQKFRSSYEKDAASLVSFFIGNGGIDGNGLDTLFCAVDAADVNLEWMYAALEHYGVGSIVPILRDARKYYDRPHLHKSPKYDQDAYHRHSKALEEFGDRICAVPETQILAQAYRTNGASLEAKNTVYL